ncbi:hypothetical protein SUGI_0446600 [Cryptomeria japonica]|nr:hypothetical protein SUGI_0446600 [Cryptomeria japonica]
MVEKLTSLGAKVNECSRERQEARREVEETRRKLAAMEELNYQILQQKDGEIQHLQNCLLSMPRVDIPISSSSAD